MITLKPTLSVMPIIADHIPAAADTQVSNSNNNNPNEISQIQNITKGQHELYRTTLDFCYSTLKKTNDFMISFFNQVKNTILNTDLLPWFADVNKFAIQIERVFNVLECIPLVCVLSSYLRIIAGKTQILFGTLVAILGEGGKLICPKNENAGLFNKFHSLTIYGTEQILHGGLNIFRGVGTGYLAAYTLQGLGNILLVVPNLNNKFLAHQLQYDTYDKVDVKQ